MELNLLSSVNKYKYFYHNRSHPRARVWHYSKYNKKLNLLQGNINPLVMAVVNQLNWKIFLDPWFHLFMN